MSNDAISPDIVARGIASTTGVEKIRKSVLHLIILGSLGGAYVAFGAQLATTLAMDAHNFIGIGLSRMVSGVAFSVGLIFVVLTRAELFTGNSLLALSVFERKASIGGLLRNWSIVLFANLLGSLIVVALVLGSGLWKLSDGALGVSAINIANVKVNLSFLEALSRGVLCNWLVCLAVWLATSAQTVPGKVLSCVFPVMAFVTSGFEHCIANLFFIPMGLVLKGMALAEASPYLTTGGMIVRNLLPVTLGNIVGGVVFVAGLKWIVFLRRAPKVA